ncbi:Uncharacterised protein [Serratia marcescens]|nr:Uncharacterised protein [Serratia marcescens]
MCINLYCYTVFSVCNLRNQLSSRCLVFSAYFTELTDSFCTHSLMPCTNRLYISFRCVVGFDDSEVYLHRRDIFLKFFNFLFKTLQHTSTSTIATTVFSSNIIIILM